MRDDLYYSSVNNPENKLEGNSRYIINNWFLIIIGLQSEAVLDVIKDLIGKARKHGRRQARTFYSQLVEIIEEY
jgi:hypothetical protein